VKSMTPITIVKGSACGSATCKAVHVFRPPPNGSVLGNWLLFDHFDSARALRANAAPHAHVGMAVVTYLFEGRLRHRDLLGNDLIVKPNMLSWFYAGSGAIHCDQQPQVERLAGRRLHGMELWISLPRPNEGDAPAFVLHETSALPSIVIGGARVRVLLGEGFGVVSPVETPTILSMFDIRLAPGAALALPAPPMSTYLRGVYVISGSVDVLDQRVATDQLAVISPTLPVGITANGGAAHVIVLGSPPMIGPRYLSGYIASSSKHGVDDAKRRAEAGGFGVLSEE